MQRVLAVVVLCVLPCPALAGTASGYANSALTISGGWSGEGYATHACDGVKAVNVVSGPESAGVLHLHQFSNNLVPEGAVVNGVEFRIHLSVFQHDVGATWFYNLYLTNAAGNQWGGNFGERMNEVAPGTYTLTVGGPTDKWGLGAMDKSTVEGSALCGLQFSFATDDPMGSTVQVDCVERIVYFDAPPNSEQEDCESGVTCGAPGTWVECVCASADGGTVSSTTCDCTGSFACPCCPTQDCDGDGWWDTCDGIGCGGSLCDCDNDGQAETPLGEGESCEDACNPLCECDGYTVPKGEAVDCLAKCSSCGGGRDAEGTWRPCLNCSLIPAAGGGTQWSCLPCLGSGGECYGNGCDADGDGFCDGGRDDTTVDGSGDGDGEPTCKDCPCRDYQTLDFVEGGRDTNGDGWCDVSAGAGDCCNLQNKFAERAAQLRQIFVNLGWDSSWVVSEAAGWNLAVEFPWFHGATYTLDLNMLPTSGVLGGAIESLRAVGRGLVGVFFGFAWVGAVWRTLRQY